MASTRIVDLPFAYEIRIIPPGKRKFDTFIVRDFAPAMLDSVSSAEAPVAMTVEIRDGYEAASPEDRARFFPNGPTKTDFRYHDGRLFQPIGGLTPIGIDDFQTSVKLSDLWRTRFMATAQTPFRKDMYPRLPALGRDSSASTLSLPTLDEQLAHLGHGRARIVGGDLSRRRDEAMNILAKSLLIIDGIVWTTSFATEPVYQVISTRDRVEVDLVLAANPLSYGANFRIDDFVAAKAFAEAEARLRGFKPAAIAYSNNVVTILEPSAVRRDNVVMTAEQALRGLGVIITNRKQVEPWPERADQLEDSLKALRAKRDLDPRDAAEILMLLEELGGILASVPGHTARELVDGTAMARRRWRNVEMPRRLDLTEQIEAEDADMAALEF